jgi:hypothetical protein
LKTLFGVNTKSDPISTAEHGFKVPILSPVSARTVSPVDSPRFPIGNGGEWRAITARSQKHHDDTRNHHKIGALLSTP